jgi:hypothetical protein
MVRKYEEKKYIGTPEALRIASEKGYTITLMTMITWIKKYKLGEKFFGNYKIEKERLLKLLKDGKIDEDRKGTKHQK